MTMMEQGVGLGVALERLYKRRTFGVKPGLDVVRKLCEHTGHPERDILPIHIAGTNGKGSTAAMIEAVLRYAGVKPGLFTSPHLVRFNERVRLNGKDADDVSLAAALDQCESVAAEVTSSTGQEPTFFEVATVMAFLCMRDAGVRVAVIETGLGGRLDATNVVDPLLSVITHIGMDHQQYLGDSLSAIAREKAGIIKPGRPVISAPQSDEAAVVLRSVAAASKSHLRFAPDVVSLQCMKSDAMGYQKVRIETLSGISGLVQLPLDGIHQLENLGVAVAALELIFDELGLVLNLQTLRKGLLGIRWPARMQILSDTPLVCLDAAHNTDGARVLVKSLQARGWREYVLVTGMCEDKDIAGFVSIVAGQTKHVYCCPIPGERGIAPDRLAAFYTKQGVEVEICPSVELAVNAAEIYATSVGLPVLITGSVFLAGAVLDMGSGNE